jgi:hypothetical protein
VARRGQGSNQLELVVPVYFLRVGADATCDRLRWGVSGDGLCGVFYIYMVARECIARHACCVGADIRARRSCASIKQGSYVMRLAEACTVATLGPNARLLRDNRSWKALRMARKPGRVRLPALVEEPASAG